MTEEDEKYFRNVNIDKAKNTIRYVMVALIISILTYIPPLVIFKIFDFGLIIELLALISVILAIKFLKKYDEEGGEFFIKITIFIIWGQVFYDVITYINLCIANKEILLDELYYLILNLGIFVIALLLLFHGLKNIKKAKYPKIFKESTDWFYERKKD